MRDLSILIPCFNSAKTISTLIEKLSEAQAQADSNGQKKGGGWECIFIDDGSTDLTSETIKFEISKTNLRFKLEKTENFGKSQAVATAAALATSTHCIILDSDLELDPVEINKLWAVVIAGKSNYVLGYRKFYAQSSYSYFYSVGNKLISNIYGILFNKVVTDIMCGYKLLPTDFILNMPKKFKKFGIEVEILLEMWNLRITPYEIEVSYFPRNREDGKSIYVKHAIAIVLKLIVYRIMHLKPRKSNINNS